MPRGQRTEVAREEKKEERRQRRGRRGRRDSERCRDG
jgi:hypothetical protein